MDSNAAEALWQEPRPTDQQVISLVRDGDMDAFAILADRYYRQLARHLTQRCGHADLAADLTQETFAEAFRDLDRFDGKGTFAAWLYAIAHNRLRMHWRRQQVRRLVSLDWPRGIGCGNAGTSASAGRQHAVPRARHPGPGVRRAHSGPPRRPGAAQPGRVHRTGGRQHPAHLPQRRRASHQPRQGAVSPALSRVGR